MGLRWRGATVRLDFLFGSLDALLSFVKRLPGLRVIIHELINLHLEKCDDLRGRIVLPRDAKTDISLVFLLLCHAPAFLSEPGARNLQLNILLELLARDFGERVSLPADENMAKPDGPGSIMMPLIGHTKTFQEGVRLRLSLFPGRPCRLARLVGRGKASFALFGALLAWCIGTVLPNALGLVGKTVLTRRTRLCAVANLLSLSGVLVAVESVPPIRMELLEKAFHKKVLGRLTIRFARPGHGR